MVFSCMCVAAGGNCRSAIVLLASVALLAAGTAGAHDGAHEAPDSQVRVLGDIEFPTTTDSKAAQQAFVSGMLLLHLFEYPYAADEFRLAREIDPDFTMAYWGEAMTHNHPIWDEQDREKARSLLAELAPTPGERLESTASPKERDYLRSLEILYGEGAKRERDEAYMRHMQAMAQRYPDDQEVQLFHALSLFGVQAGVRDIPTYIEAAAIAQRVFYANRRHPGAAHYFIHGVDDPVHAPLALEAARALAEIAPDAGHSLHMTSHIFLALGMWDDVVKANLNAADASNRMAAEQGRPERHWGHYNYWLLYGLLQQGRQDDARELLVRARDELEASGSKPTDTLELDPDRSHTGSVVQMWARFMIETRGLDEKIGRWEFEFADAFDPALNFHYVHGVLGTETERIEAHHRAFRALKTELAAEIAALERQAPSDLLYLDRLAVMDQQFQAAIARADGELGRAIGHAREASRLEGEMPHSFGPPFVDLPSAEMLAGLLMDAGDFAGAAAAYSLQLERTRRKPRPLLGLAEAAGEMGNDDRAEFAMAQYRAITDQAGK